MDLGAIRYHYGFIKVLNVASNLGAGATISACVCSLYVYQHVGPDTTIHAYRVFKPWVEGDDIGVNNDDGDLTWNDWSSDANEWTTAGELSRDDGGSDNSGDGTGADCKATPEDVAIPDDDTWMELNMSTELAQGWYDETMDENGVFLWYFRPFAATNAFMYSTEYTTDPSLCPFWTFTYTTGGGPAAAGQVIIIGGD